MVVHPTCNPRSRPSASNHSERIHPSVRQDRCSARRGIVRLMTADVLLPAPSFAARWIRVSLVWARCCTSTLGGDPASDLTVLKPDGQPAAGARLHLVRFPRDKPPMEWRGQANDKGLFTLSAESIGSTDGCLTIDHPDCSIAIARTGPWGLHPREGSNPPTGRVFQLKPQRFLRGRVIDETQNGISGARVVITLLGARTYVPLSLHDARAGQPGGHASRLHPGLVLPGQRMGSEAGGPDGTPSGAWREPDRGGRDPALEGARGGSKDMADPTQGAVGDNGGHG